MKMTGWVRYRQQPAPAGRIIGGLVTSLRVFATREGQGNVSLAKIFLSVKDKQ